MSETAHRSAMEGGDAIPESRRDLINKGHEPSFDPNGPSTNHASSGDAAEAQSKATGAANAAKEAAEKAEKEAKEAKQAELTKASKAAAAAKDAKAAPKAASLSQKKSKDIEGYEDRSFEPHPILPNTLHNDQMQKIDSVAGPDRITQIGESVHRSAMEGGDANPDRSRAFTGNATPASFTPDYSKTTVKSSGDAASADFKAKGEAIKAKEAEKAAEAAKVEAE